KCVVKYAVRIPTRSETADAPFTPKRIAAQMTKRVIGKRNSERSPWPSTITNHSAVHAPAMRITASSHRRVVAKSALRHCTGDGHESMKGVTRNTAIMLPPNHARHERK